MKSALTFVLIFIAVVKCQNLDDIQLFSQCDRTVATGVATCMQYFSPIKFVTDFLNSDKESLCCTHFRHTACISGVRDAVRVAKSANMCPDSFSEEVISTLTDSSINTYIRKSCKTFNSGKCVMESVGDVVNTIQGFFLPQPQQQKPVIPQLIQSVPRLFDRNGGNYYSVDDNNRNHNYGNQRNNERTDPSLFNSFNSFREIISPRRVVTTPTPRPFNGQTIRDLFDRQYVPEASDIQPTKENADEDQTDYEDPLRGLLTGLLPMGRETKERNDSSDEPSIFSAIGDIFNSGVNQNQNSRNSGNGQNFFSDLFGNLNETDSHIVKDITDAIN